MSARIKYGSRRRVRTKIRHLAPLVGCAYAFEEWVYGGRKVPLSHEMAQMISTQFWCISQETDHGSKWPVSYYQPMMCGVQLSCQPRRARYLSRMRRPTGIQEVAGSIIGSGTVFRRDLVMNNFYGHSLHTVDASRAVASYWRKYGNLVLVNRLGSQPRNSVDRLPDRARNDLNSVEEP